MEVLLRIVNKFQKKMRIAKGFPFFFLRVHPIHSNPQNALVASQAFECNYTIVHNSDMDAY